MKITNVYYVFTNFLLLLLSFIILCLGVIGEYISLILLKVTKRPFTTSKEVLNINNTGENNKMFGH